MSTDSQLLQTTQISNKRTNEEAELHLDSSDEPVAKRARIIESIVKYSLTEMPNEILLRIFSHLNAKDLCTCSEVSKKFIPIVDSSPMWFSLARRIHNYIPTFSYRVDFLFALGQEQTDALLAWADFHLDGKYIPKQTKFANYFYERLISTCENRKPSVFNDQMKMEAKFRQCELFYNYSDDFENGNTEALQILEELEKQENANAVHKAKIKLYKAIYEFQGLDRYTANLQTYNSFVEVRDNEEALMEDRLKAKLFIARMGYDELVQNPTNEESAVLFRELIDHPQTRDLDRSQAKFYLADLLFSEKILGNNFEATFDLFMEIKNDSSALLWQRLDAAFNAAKLIETGKINRGINEATEIYQWVIDLKGVSEVTKIEAQLGIIEIANKNGELLLDLPSDSNILPMILQIKDNEDHTYQQRHRADFYLATMRFSGYTDIISDEEAYRSLKQYYQSAQTAEDRAVARLYSCIMCHDRVTDPYKSDDVVVKELTQLNKSEFLAKRDRDRAEFYATIISVENGISVNQKYANKLAEEIIENPQTLFYDRIKAKIFLIGNWLNDSEDSSKIKIQNYLESLSGNSELMPEEEAKVKLQSIRFNEVQEENSDTFITSLAEIVQNEEAMLADRVEAAVLWARVCVVQEHHSLDDPQVRENILDILADMEDPGLYIPYRNGILEGEKELQNLYKQINDRVTPPAPPLPAPILPPTLQPTQQQPPNNNERPWYQFW